MSLPSKSEEAGNVAILQEAYRRWSESRGGSADHWVSICDENLQFGTLAEPLASLDYMTSYRRREDLGQYFAGLARDWEMLDYRIDSYVAQGDRVVALGHCSWRARKSGAVVTTPKADSWRFKGGKAIAYYEFFDTAQVAKAIG